MAYIPVTIEDFQTFFARDFNFTSDDSDLSKVTGADIERAFSTSLVNFNEGLWSSQNQFANAFLHLSAHYLVEAIRSSSQGLNSQFNGLTASKSVGDVSEAYIIPDRVKNSPFLSSLYSTKYGATYVGMISLRLVGNVATIIGASTV